MMIEHLPQELLRCVADKCSKDDLLNLACCSRQYANIMKPILWQSVCINISELSGKEPHRFESLQYTTRLRIRRDLMVETVTNNQAGIHTGFILSQILNYCDPVKVKKLIVRDVGELTGRCVLGVLKCVERLEINNFLHSEQWSFEKVTDVLPQLTELDFPYEIQIDQVTKILEKSRFQSLSLYLSEESYETLKLISKEKTLRKLHLECDPPNQLLDLKPLVELSNLTELWLDGSFTEESFVYLCNNLHKLQTLGIGSSEVVNDDYFREINRLTSLTHLSLESERTELTGRCLQHISLIRSLRSLTFYDSIFDDDEDTENSEYVQHLNKIASLEKMKVFSYEENDSMSKTMNKIVLGLVKEKSWNLKFNAEDEYFICSPTK